MYRPVPRESRGLAAPWTGRPGRRRWPSPASARLGRRAQVGVDPADADLGRRELDAERRVVAAILDEVLIEAQSRPEQVAAKGLHAGDLQELALADLGEVVVHGGPGLGEVGLGAIALELGFLQGGLGLVPRRLGEPALLGLVGAGHLGRVPLLRRQPAGRRSRAGPADASSLGRSARRPSRRPGTRSATRRGSPPAGCAGTTARIAPSAWSGGPGSARRRGSAASRPPARRQWRSDGPGRARSPCGRSSPGRAAPPG